MPRNRNKGARPRGQPVRRRGRRALQSRAQSAWRATPALIPSRFSLLAPPEMFVKLEYTDTYVNVAAATVTRSYAFNDLFDPNVSGVGAQPVGFDQWCALYGRYEVTACRTVHELYNTAAANTVLMVVYPSLSATAVTGTADAAGQPRAVTLRTTGTGAVPFAKTTTMYNVSTIIGRNIASINYTGAAGASPANRIYTQYVIGSLDGVTLFAITLRVQMFFYVRFYERINMDRS